MTDIDALLKEANAWQDRYSLSRDKDAEILIGELVDALTAERARVVELEAFRNGYKDYIRKLQDSAEAERTKVAALEAEVERLNKALTYEEHRSGRQGTHGPGCHEWGPQHYECLKAEAARWREVASELAKMLELSRATCLMDCGPVLAESWSDPRIEAALTRFKQESK